MNQKDYMEKMKLLNKLNRVGCSIDGRAAVLISELTGGRDDEDDFIKGRDDQEEEANNGREKISESG